MLTMLAVHAHSRVIEKEIKKTDSKLCQEQKYMTAIIRICHSMSDRKKKAKKKIFIIEIMPKQFNA